jgi:hypothetical protein
MQKYWFYIWCANLGVLVISQFCNTNQTAPKNRLICFAMMTSILGRLVASAN